MPPTSSSTARGRQPTSKPLAASTNVTSSTASTRAKVSASTKLQTSKSTSGTLKANARHYTKPGKASILKASERGNNKSTSTCTDTVSSSTEATPATNSQPSGPASTPTPKETTDALTESKPNTESTDPGKEVADLPNSTTNSGPLPPKAQNIEKPKLTTPAPPSDPLQVAAQLYPWLYMTSTLDACFKSAEQTAKKDLETRVQQLTESESELADQKARFHAERAAELFDVLSTGVFEETAPRIMQAFLAHGEACEQAEAGALRLASNPAKIPSEEEEEDEDWDAPLRIYAKMLDTLDQLHAEALELEVSIVKLTTSTEPPADCGVSKDVIHDKPSELNADVEHGAQAQIVGVFKACLPVLRARIANLAMAQELVDGARENTSISLRMESLGLLY